MSNLRNIIVGCLDNNRKAQKELYNYLSPKLMYICYRYAGSKYLAQDYLHDAFMHIIQNLAKYSEDKPFDAWAKRVTINVILSEKRKKNILDDGDELAAAENIEGSNENSDAGLLANDLSLLVLKLPEGKRVIFNMAVIEGYSHKEIAEQLNINEGTSRSQLAKAKEMLRDLVIEYNKINEESLTRKY